MSLLDIKRRAQGIAPTEQPAADRVMSLQAKPARDLQAMHKASAACHARHDPPQAGAEYWEWALNDMKAVSGLYDNDLLIMSLLSVVFADLERSYKRMLAAQESAQVVLWQQKD